VSKYTTADLRTPRHPRMSAPPRTRTVETQTRHEPREVTISRAPSPGPRCTKILTRERPDVEGAIVGPKERERRLAEQRVDRSHRRTRGAIRGRRRPRPWRRRKKAELVLSLALIVSSVILVVVPFVLRT
jgi:hypothetical protein